MTYTWLPDGHQWLDYKDERNNTLAFVSKFDRTTYPGTKHKVFDNRYWENDVDRPEFDDLEAAKRYVEVLFRLEPVPC